MTTLYEVQHSTTESPGWKCAIVGKKNARFGEIERARYPTLAEARDFLDATARRRNDAGVDRLGRSWRIERIKTKHLFVYDPFRQHDESGRRMKGVDRWIWLGEFVDRNSAIDAAAAYGIEYEDRIRLMAAKEHRPRGRSGIPYSTTLFNPDRAGVRRIVGRLVGSGRR